MYQFTRDFVINDNAGKIKDDATGKLSRFLVKAIDAKGNLALMIDHVANLREFEIASIYKREWQAAQNEEVKIDFNAGDASSVKKDDVLRLVITLGQDGREIATFNDQYPWHARHYFYEVLAEKDGEVTANDVLGLLKGIDRDNSLSDLRYFDYEYTSGTEVLFKASDPYTRFLNVRFVKVGKDSDGLCACDPYKHVAETLTGFRDFEVIFDLVKKDFLNEVSPVVSGSYKEGTQGNGNVAQIINNLRVPTFEHMDWFGMNTNGVELPVPGGKYDQYLIEYVTERRQIGHQVMGAIDKSLVSFVFYVEQTVSGQFDAELDKLKKVAVKDMSVGAAGSASYDDAVNTSNLQWNAGFEPAKALDVVDPVNNAPDKE